MNIDFDNHGFDPWDWDARTQRMFNAIGQNRKNVRLRQIEDLASVGLDGNKISGLINEYDKIIAIAGRDLRDDEIEPSFPPSGIFLDRANILDAQIRGAFRFLAQTENQIKRAESGDGFIDVDLDFLEERRDGIKHNLMELIEQRESLSESRGEDYDIQDSLADPDGGPWEDNPEYDNEDGVIE